MRRLAAAVAAGALLAGGAVGAGSARADSFTPVTLAIDVPATATVGTALPASVTVTADAGVLDTAEGQLVLGVKLAPECGGNFETTSGVTLLHAPLSPAPQLGQGYTGTVQGSGTPTGAGDQTVCVYLEDTGADRVYANDESGQVTVAPAGSGSPTAGSGPGSGSGTKAPGGDGSGAKGGAGEVTATQRHALRAAQRALTRTTRAVAAATRRVTAARRALDHARGHRRVRARHRLRVAEKALRAARRAHATAERRLRRARRHAGLPSRAKPKRKAAKQKQAVQQADAAAGGLPPVRHVFVIVLENESASTTFGAGSPAPYLAQTLPAEGAYLPNYYGVGHNSNDNYIAMISGQAPGIQSQADCQDFDDLLPGTIGADGQAIGTGCVYPAAVPTIASQLTAAGDTWRDYNESMGDDPTRESAQCGHPAVGSQDRTQTAEAQDMYATRHNPFVYFHSIIDDTTLCDTHVVNLDALPQDLASPSSTANYSFITPDLCDDGHDAPCANGQPGGLTSANSFLKTWVPRITGSPAFQQNGLLIVTFDEADTDDASSCCGEIAGPNSPLPGITGMGGGDVGAVLLSPYIAPGTVSTTAYNHYSMLGSVEDLFGLPHLGYAQLPGETDFGSDVYTDPAGTAFSGTAPAGGTGGGPGVGGSGPTGAGSGASSGSTTSSGSSGSSTSGGSSAGPAGGRRGALRVTVRRPARACIRASRVRLRVRWRGVGAKARYRVEVRDRTVRHPVWRTIAGATRRRTAIFTARAGHVDAVRVRATRGGHTGPWTRVRATLPRRTASRAHRACRRVVLRGRRTRR